MKIIFLDIDGVLIRFGNTPQIRATREKKGDMGGIITSLDADLVENLKDLMLEDVQIVISSSWRRGMMDILRDEFYKNNLDWGRVISKTPCDLGHGRGNEILMWLDEYHKTCKSGFHITHWVAIDDDSFDMKCIARMGKLVKTETHQGLTREKTHEVFDLLNT